MAEKMWSKEVGIMPRSLGSLLTPRISVGGKGKEGRRNEGEEKIEGKGASKKERTKQAKRRRERK